MQEGNEGENLKEPELELELEEELQETEQDSRLREAVLAVRAVPKFVASSVAVAILLASVATALSLMYHYEKKDTDHLFRAVSSIRITMEDLNETYSSKSDGEIMMEARQKAEYLVIMNEANDYTVKTIDKVLQLVKEGWNPHQGNFYFFSETQGNHHDAIDDCSKKDATLAVISSSAEETFIETTAKTKGRSYWIGLYAYDNEWRWVNFMLLKQDVKFWAAGNPTVSSGERCAEVRGCDESLKCWHDVQCNQRRNWICKLAPDSKLITYGA